LNSIYYYYIFCRDFGNTSVIVKGEDDSVYGYISAYIRSEKPDTLFVWQVAVDEKARGHRLAVKMIDWILNSQSCKNVKYIETTVSPSNESSRKMFCKFAENRNSTITESEFLGSGAFGEDSHEEEILFIINLDGGKDENNR